MDRSRLQRLLEQVQSGEAAVEDALETLATLPLHAGAEVLADVHRELRCGFPEVVYAAGKTPAQCAQAAAALAAAHDRVLVTRADAEQAAAVQAAVPGAEYHQAARCLTWRSPEAPAPAPQGKVLVVCAGTSDLPVAQEALLTAQLMDVQAELVADVGVAGIHRLLAQSERLRTVDALVVVAGMEGALPSVVAGMVAVPLIAVPTSVGYGASYQGLSALLAMLTACAPGIGVVNIDNGFGGGFLAARIAKSARILP